MPTDATGWPGARIQVASPAFTASLAFFTRVFGAG